MKMILGIIFSFILLSPVLAEDFVDLYDEANLDETVTVDETTDTTTVEEQPEDFLSKNFYTLEIIKGSQSAFDKYVPITIRVTPNETPVKTQITWDSSDDLKIREKHPEFINSMVKGETYEYKIRVKPVDSGSYEITANVTAWQHDSNYTSSDSILIDFDEKLVVDSTDTNYQVLNIVKIFLIILLIGGIGVGIYFGGNKLLKVLTEYLKPPEI